MQEGMGPIVDRSKEHLGPVGRAIIATLLLLLQAVKTVQEDGDPPGTDTSYYAARAIERIFPREMAWRDTCSPRCTRKISRSQRSKRPPFTRSPPPLPPPSGRVRVGAALTRAIS